MEVSQGRIRGADLGYSDLDRVLGSELAEQRRALEREWDRLEEARRLERLAARLAGSDVPRIAAPGPGRSEPQDRCD